MSVRIDLSLPARINLVGSPTDAVEGAYATISAAVEVCGGARIGAAPVGLRFRRSSGEERCFAPGRITDAAGFSVEAAAVNALLTHVEAFAAACQRQGATIETWTDVPASSGLAGSSVLVLAVLAALREFYELDRRVCNDYVLSEIAQRAEEHEMGVVCGYADRYAPLFGGIAYLSYHGKLWHRELGQEPFVTYERLGSYVPALRFCVATSGVQRDSGSVHAPMRARYLEERRRGRGMLIDLARQLGETAWRGKMALLRHDVAAFGAQIDCNQKLVDTMMRECGFAAGAGEEVNLLIAAARANGALGAKLTGAGGGGAIFALPPPGGEERLADALRSQAARHGLHASETLVLPVTERGLRIDRREVE